MTSLKQAIHQKVYDVCLHPMKQTDAWKVLILDALSTRMLSSCSRMTDIMDEGITLVEDINKNRQPMRTMEGIYMIAPTRESIDKFVADFPTQTSEWKYKCAHLFITESLNDELFSKISQSPAVRAVKTLKEINIAVMPYESQVFSLDQPRLLAAHFAKALVGTEVRTQMLMKCADQLATLCVTLNEMPAVRFRTVPGQPAINAANEEFSKMLQEKLDTYKIDYPSMGEGSGKDKSVIIIVDRGFDPVSPILHECTMQAMAYDLLGIENDTYTYTATDSLGQKSDKETVLDENDELWTKIRHKHLADVGKFLATEVREFTKDKKVDGGGQADIKNLAAMIKKMPQYQKELAKFTQHMDMASDLMKINNNQVMNLCKVEQDLAMGADGSGEKLKDPLRLMTPHVMNQEISTIDKLRIIIMYILHNKGITIDNLDKIIASGGLQADEKEAILNLESLGVDILINPNNKKQIRHSFAPANRRGRNLEKTYEVSRWQPYLKDLLEDAIADKLDQKTFPTLGGPRQSRGGGANVRRPGWGAKAAGGAGGGGGRATGPRLIFFVLGGICYSEMRATYEVSKAAGPWDVFIGGSHILTPTSFLTALKDMQGVVEKLQIGHED